MAEVNVSALAAVAPVVQRTPASQGSAQPAEQSGQPSFAQVLKSRSQAQDAAKAAPAKTPGTSAKDRTDKAADAPADKSRTDTETASSLDPVTQTTTTAGMDPTLLLAAAAQRQTAQDNSTADLQATETGGTQDASALLAATTAALAARAASLAGNASTNSPVDTNALQDEAATRPVTGLSAGNDDKSLASQLRSEAGTRTETDAVSTDDTAEKLLAARSQDKAGSFAAELANASQNLNVEASPQTHGVLSAAHNNRTSQPLPQHEVSTPVATRGWAEEVGQKVSWIANRDNGRAELVLTPPSLGRVEVSINMQGDQASATFVAASPAAREALQDAMPRLREVLAQSGIQLGQANVNAGNSGQAQSDTSGKRSLSSRFASSGDSLSGVDAAAGTTRSSWLRQGNGMIDTFA
ncbi:flagellar hook-length control protein FliK [Uliginosibacterium sp. 31-16]|uniref:flagellar hook-length control protein FliK n=1 Tax=Uliginosibacterium sp. 31-16 TaxID=3068315 RepID=UPI00273D7BFF|nr:flagellar hook-length control protein FliK [Uliginosibacterium sp. 31-16]MDP5240782.1 flagellar hook-length control protein FliK [Uliginosibacterium sp. 31-16]